MSLKAVWFDANDSWNVSLPWHLVAWMIFLLRQYSGEAGQMERKVVLWKSSI